jgi:hypothetical protein
MISSILIVMDINDDIQDQNLNVSLPVIASGRQPEDSRWAAVAAGPIRPQRPGLPWRGGWGLGGYEHTIQTRPLYSEHDYRPDGALRMQCWRGSGANCRPSGDPGC